MLEVLQVDSKRWALVRIASCEDLPPEGALIPEAVAVFDTGDESIRNLSESPHGFYQMRLEFPPRPKVPPAQASEEGAVTQEMVVFFLANYGEYGLLYDTRRGATAVWRFTTFSDWPDRPVTFPADDLPDNIPSRHRPFFGLSKHRRRSVAEERREGESKGVEEAKDGGGT